MPAPASWLTFLDLFRSSFTAPGGRLFEQLITAWALCPGRRTLTRLWSVIPAGLRRRYGAHARWVREGHWEMDKLWGRLVVQLVQHWVPGDLLTLLLDDYAEGRIMRRQGRATSGFALAAGANALIRSA